MRISDWSSDVCSSDLLTLGENIGDVGGLSMAYRAYKLATEGQDVPVIDGFTGDQRFFLAFGQVWRSAQREDAARQRLRTDPHSRSEERRVGNEWVSTCRSRWSRSQ